MRHLLALLVLTVAPLGARASTCTDGYDLFLGPVAGHAVSTGNTCGAGNDFTGTCASSQESDDLLLKWVAPATGVFDINTFGSRYDTALTVRDVACASIACDDDSYGTTQSQVHVSVVAGEVYYIQVDGYSDDNCGDYQLHILPPCPDVDRDGVCDADDACLGGNWAGDSDGDGVCDDVDACVGDDATGDADGDGLCDGSDFVLDDPVVFGGSPLTLSVRRAEPSSAVTFLASARGYGAGPCIPGGVCVDIRNPVILGSAEANGSGRASLEVLLIPAEMQGETLTFQAVWRRAGRADETEVDPAYVR